MGVARRWLALACVLGAMVAGCTVNPEDEEPATTTTASPSATDSGPASPSPTTPAFGSDVEVPADGVGSVRVSDVDDWTLINRGDNAYAQVLSPAAAPALAVEAQATIGEWLSDYRAATTATTPAEASPTPPAPTSPATETGTGTTSPDDPTATDDPTAATTVPEAGASFRALGQVVAARSDVAGIRLYGRTTTGGTPTERWRTIWFDPTQNRVVDGTALFATARSGEDPLSRARQLAIAAASEGDLGGVSDRDLFHAAAFTPRGDLVLYVARAGAAPSKVVLAAADVDELLSALGRQAKVAAADSVPASPGPGPEATSPTTEPASPTATTPTTDPTATDTDPSPAGTPTP